MDELATTFGDGAASIEVGLDLDGPAETDRAKQVLAGIDGVDAVTPPPSARSVWRLAVRPAGAEERVRQDVLAAAVAHNLRLTSIQPIVPSLDDIYRSAVVRRAA
jgi:hypothetical protein